MLNLDQLQVAVAAAKRQFDLIGKKYPDLKAKLPNGKPAAVLVMSLPGGQTGIDSSPMQILSEFPAMVVDDSTKTSALNLLSCLKTLEPEAATGPETERLRKQLDQLAPQLKYDEKCQVEIRFNDLNYDLIWKLQADDLVDRNLTPQTKASIRIVLGTLAQFERTIPPNTMSFTSLDFETANHSRVSICAAGIAVFEDGNLTEAPLLVGAATKRARVVSAGVH